MIRHIYNKILSLYRKMKYSFLSTNSNISGDVIKHQPVIMNGLGAIEFGSNVHVGIINSPRFYDGYAYIEARSRNSIITFGNNIHINNSFSAIAEKCIRIGNDVLIGYHCNISDSDFHNLAVDKRMETDPTPEEVVIGNNVFIGNNVTILKGVFLGENCVVASGAVVTKSFAPNSILGGVPAKVIGSV